MEKKTTENNVFFMYDGIVNEDVYCPEVIKSRLCNNHTLGLVERGAWSWRKLFYV